MTIITCLALSKIIHFENANFDGIARKSESEISIIVRAD